MISQKFDIQCFYSGGKLFKNSLIPILCLFLLPDTAVRKLMLQVDQELRKENKKFSDMFKNSLLVKQS